MLFRSLLGFTGIILPPAMPPGTEPPQCEQKQHPQLGNKYNKEKKKYAVRKITENSIVLGREDGNIFFKWGKKQNKVIDDG